MVKSRVIEIGEFADFDDVDVIILFNNTSPEGLREVCVIHEYDKEITPDSLDLLKVGSVVKFGDNEYSVKEIGKVANSTLKELGHASFYFGLDEDDELLPGSVLLEPAVKPTISVGDTIEFIY